MIQGLCVLVAEIKTGALALPGEPCYELFFKAAQTIQAILDSRFAQAPKPYTLAGNEEVPDAGPSPSTIDWDAFVHADPWAFELDFWENLATHPTLSWNYGGNI